jgi:Flp pilus assembly protein TadD
MMTRTTLTTVGRLIALVATGAVLGGCTRSQDAFALMREQQQIQAAVQAQEAEQRGKDVADDRQVYLSLIRRMQSDGLYFASLAHVDAYRARYGSTPELALMRADALRATGQDAESDAAYRALLDSPQAAQAWHGLGLLAGQRGHYAEAVERLAQAAAREPANAVVLGDLGYARLRTGDVTGARLPLIQAAELAPTNARAIANLALLLAVQGDTAGAVRVMDKGGLSAEARQGVETLAGQITQAHRARVAPVAVDPQTPAASAALGGSAPAVLEGGATASAATLRHASSPSAFVQPPAAPTRSARLPAMQEGPLQTLFDRFGVADATTH